MNFLKSFRTLFSLSPENVILRETTKTQLELIEHTKSKQYYCATVSMLEKRLGELKKMTAEIEKEMKDSKL